MPGYIEIARSVRRLKEAGAQAGVIGKSVRGKDIFFVAVGAEKKAAGGIIVTAAIHAREHVTAHAAIVQAERLLRYNRMLAAPVYIVPLVNPDGAEIALCREKPPEFFTGDARLYKANARGVDLNVNFDAGWGTGKSNVFFPAGENYVGEKPFSEPETAALKDFTLEVRPSATISYHTKGRVVYYDFGLDPVRKKYCRRLAVKTARTLGYKVVDGDCGSAGGYKDWCEYKLGIAAFTVEMGDDKLRHPLSEEDITEDCERSALLPLQLEKWMRLTKK